jgi:hypothetical protein
MNTPHWTAYLSALLTPVIALFAVYVAAAQWQTARNKLRFDLFEKRFAVYDAARSFLGSIMTSGTVKNEALGEYLQGIHAAKWIVGPDVDDYLDREIYLPAIQLQCLDAELEGVPVGPVRTENVKKQTEIKRHLNNQFENLDVWFRAYLQLKH